MVASSTVIICRELLVHALSLEAASLTPAVVTVSPSVIEPLSTLAPLSSPARSPSVRNGNSDSDMGGRHVSGPMKSVEADGADRGRSSTFGDNATKPDAFPYTSRSAITRSNWRTRRFAHNRLLRVSGVKTPSLPPKDSTSAASASISASTLASLSAENINPVIRTISTDGQDGLWEDKLKSSSTTGDARLSGNRSASTTASSARSTAGFSADVGADFVRTTSFLRRTALRRFQKGGRVGATVPTRSTAVSVIDVAASIGPAASQQQSPSLGSPSSSPSTATATTTTDATATAATLLGVSGSAALSNDTSNARLEGRGDDAILMSIDFTSIPIATAPSIFDESGSEAESLSGALNSSIGSSGTNHLSQSESKSTSEQANGELGQQRQQQGSAMDIFAAIKARLIASNNASASSSGVSKQQAESSLGDDGVSEFQPARTAEATSMVNIIEKTPSLQLSSSMNPLVGSLEPLALMSALDDPHDEVENLRETVSTSTKAQTTRNSHEMTAGEGKRAGGDGEQINHAGEGKGPAGEHTRGAAGGLGMERVLLTDDNSGGGCEVECEVECEGEVVTAAGTVVCSEGVLTLPLPSNSPSFLDPQHQLEDQYPQNEGVSLGLDRTRSNNDGRMRELPHEEILWHEEQESPREPQEEPGGPEIQNGQQGRTGLQVSKEPQGEPGVQGEQVGLLAQLGRLGRVAQEVADLRAQVQDLDDARAEQMRTVRISVEKSFYMHPI